MINNWSKFNEINSEEINSRLIQSIRGSLLKSLKDKIEDIRDIFTEFSDNKIIERYSCEASQSLISCRDNNFDKFVSDITYTFKPKDLYSLHGGDGKITIYVTLYLPGKVNSNDKMLSSNAILSFESIPILEDVIVAAKRLESSGFEVDLDFNATHREFKPVIFRITFGI